MTPGESGERKMSKSNGSNWYYFEHFPAFRVVNRAGVIIAVGSLADCERVKLRRPDTEIEWL